MTGVSTYIGHVMVCWKDDLPFSSSSLAWTSVSIREILSEVNSDIMVAVHAWLKHGLNTAVVFTYNLQQKPGHYFPIQNFYKRSQEWCYVKVALH